MKADELERRMAGAVEEVWGGVAELEPFAPIARDAIAALREAEQRAERLRGYADHDQTCALHTDWRNGATCDCGLSALLASLTTPEAHDGR